MRLPAALNRAIDSEAAQHDHKLLTRAVEDMTFRYRCRAKDTGAFVSTPLHRAAYVITRFPATFAAVAAVLSEIKSRMPEFAPADLLDLGILADTEQTVPFETALKVLRHRGYTVEEA